MSERLLDHAAGTARRLPGLVGLAVLGIARVQVHDRRTGLGRADRRVGDLLRRHRQIGRHGRRVDRAGHRAGDDDLAPSSHFPTFSSRAIPPSPCAPGACRGAHPIRRRSRERRRATSCWRGPAPGGPFDGLEYRSGPIDATLYETETAGHRFPGSTRHGRAPASANVEAIAWPIPAARALTRRRCPGFIPNRSGQACVPPLIGTGGRAAPGPRRARRARR